MANFSTYFAIEKKMKRIGVQLDRSEWISIFTDGSKNSLTTLTPTEYREFIVFMNQSLKKEQISTDRELKQRRKVIALFAQMGYVTEELKSDMKRINEWCVQYGHKHVELNHYHSADLTKLVSQAQETYNSFIHDIKL